MARSFYCGKEPWQETKPKPEQRLMDGRRSVWQAYHGKSPGGDSPGARVPHERQRFLLKHPRSTRYLRRKAGAAVANALKELDIFPHTPHEVGVYTLALAVAYLLLVWVLRLQTPEPAKVFDAAVFATSVLLLCGVIDEQVAKALGDTTSFLIIAGLVGVLYSVRTLFK